MSKKLQTIRGTHDLLKNDMHTHLHVVETARRIAKTYGFDSISTPIFETTEVFQRPLGETSDVVTKEMYTFDSRSGDSLTLRPEGTAGFVRSFIQHGLYEKTPYRAFYEGAMFRYERPQKGRQRQFHQFGVETLGIESPQIDVETIALGWDILCALNIEKDIVLHINTLGDKESRNAYRDALVTYLTPYMDTLSDDSKTRLEKNPLRILDSKSESDQKILQNAPRFEDYLNQESASFYTEVCAGLDALHIPYEKNPFLVRGFDYYCHTAFEFITTTLGAQGTVLGGGRYDGLVQQMGGNPTPGIGFAGGIERLCLMVTPPPTPNTIITIISMGNSAHQYSITLSHALRKNGLRVENIFGGTMKKHMKFADKINAKYAILIGDDELSKNSVTLRNLETGTQSQISMDTVIHTLKTESKNGMV